MAGTIDYLSGTFSTLGVEACCALLAPYAEGFVSGYGSFGYLSVWIAEGFRVYHGGDMHKGCYVQASGAGCAQVAEHAGFDGWGNLAIAWLKLGFKATRVDLAFDDKTGRLPKDEIMAKAIAHDYIGRYRLVTPGIAYDGEEVTKWLVHLGDIRGNSSVTIYDKRLERIARGLVDPGPWMRVELRYRDKGAVEFFNWLSGNNTLEGAEGFLRGALNFIERSEIRDRSLDTVCGWWSDFLADAAKLYVRVVRDVRDFAAISERFVKAQGPTLAMLVLGNCGGRFRGKWLTDLIAEGWKKMNPKQERLLWEHGKDNPTIRGLLGSSGRAG